MMMMMKISDDILTEILHRLPLSSLVRFRYVCKHWLSLVSSPFLTYPLLDRTIASGDRRVVALSQEFYTYAARLTLLDDSCRPIGPPIPIGRCPPPIQISPSCNGIVCVHSNTTAYLLNPTTKELLRLPNPSPALDSSCLLEFLPATNQYKVLRLYAHNSAQRCEVLTVGEKWRQISEFRRTELPIEGAIVDGVAYFIAWTCLEETGAIVSFDPRDEKFRTVAFPNPRLLREEGTKVCEMGGRLCLSYGLEFPSHAFRILALEDTTWSLLFASRSIYSSYFMDNMSKHAQPLLLAGGKILVLRESSPGGLFLRLKLAVEREEEKGSSTRTET